MADRPQRTVYELVNRILDGGLDQQLRKWRSAGVSVRAMTILLSHDVGVAIHRDTVGRWLRDLDNETNGEAA